MGAMLWSNTTQALLNLELCRRAKEAATKCLSFDEKHAKALYHRSVANEKLKCTAEALSDMIDVQKVGGGGMSDAAVEQRIELLQDKLSEEKRIQKELDDSSEDEADNELLEMKRRVDEVVEKYDLANDDSASEVADWLTSGEWNVTVKKVAERWGMDVSDSLAFLRWIAKGIEFKETQRQNQEQANMAPGVPD